jgi:uncharacterized membrane protein
VAASIFRFLFKYEPLVFEQGKFVFGATRSMWVVAAIAAGAAVYALLTYRRLGNITGRERVRLLALRLPLFLLVVFALLRPMLLLKVAVPQQNFVGILLDDSRSMQIADEAGKPRAEFVKDEFGRVDGPLLTALGKRFVVRLFRFSNSAERLQSSGDLAFQGTATRLGDALDRARDELSGLPVAGMVVVSDGADNSDSTIDQSIAGLKAQAMPVFAVGVGKDQLARDVQLTRVETPRRVLKGTALVIDAVVTATGFAGVKVPLIVEDAGRVVSQQDITLPADGESATVHVRFLTNEAGPRVFKFRVPVQDGEEVSQNNEREALIDVFDRREKLLYLEDLRPESKFIRQATDADNNLQVSLLERTANASVNAPEKYWRAGLDTPQELAGGFPTTREELFAYRGIVLGSIEASAFTPEQQRMLEDFVDVRGGGLLALGGDASFSEGGWAGTPLAETLPIGLDRSVKGAARYFDQLIVRPTKAGANHPATQIADKESDAAAKWRDLTPLSTVNIIKDVKPGATVLLDGVDERGHTAPVLTYQRFGKGKSVAMTVADSWLWRMQMPITDTTHHTFWQRVARWLVDGVPDRVMVTGTPDHVEKGEPVTLTAQVVDPAFKGVDNGRITAHVTTPSGAVEDVPMTWTVQRDGEYTARYTPTEDGVFNVSVAGTYDAATSAPASGATGSGGGKDTKDTGAGKASFRVAPSDAEYFDAAMRAPLLKRVADETEGRFFRASDTSKLVDAITYSGRGITVVDDKELWDMPIILFFLLGLMAAEWGYRRGRGLA